MSTMAIVASISTNQRHSAKTYAQSESSRQLCEPMEEVKSMLEASSASKLG